ncbi:MAG: hypothetical protein LBG11_03590 [Bifidobacteriaceae bacterium]|nr:hypothetical protein [Bifidobacteriaceae bacterium]
MTVIAITSIILVAAVSLTLSFGKQNANNLARQDRVDNVRQVSVWLTDALTYSAPVPSSSDVPIVEVAQKDRLVFTSALPVAGATAHNVSRVSLVVSQACWPGGPAEAGVLRRCVQSPVVAADGTQSFCDHGTTGCSDDLFDDFVVVRNVNDNDLFTYSLTGESAVYSDVTTLELRGRIKAVELSITVSGASGSADEDIQATVVRRHTLKGWREL